MPDLTIETVISNMPKSGQIEFLRKQTKGNLSMFCSQINWQDASIRAADAFFAKIGEQSPTNVAEKIGHGLIALGGQNPHYKDGWKRCAWMNNSPPIIEALKAAVIAAGDIALSIKNLPESLKQMLKQPNLEREPTQKLINTKDVLESVEVDLEQCSTELETQGYFDPKNEIDARKKIVTSIVQRAGQGRFREQLLEAYANRCAITECDVAFALEAAHILPYKGKHTNDVRNGLLLRADIHTLFDLGKLSINPKNYCVMLAPDIRKTSYRCFHEKPIILPKDDRQKPDREALEIHFKKWLA